ncbi:HlyD family secretion protein [Campylobacter pinnipediorum]|uniref:HlyD family secretion protein n=1 Tax=Campylobacter pinnipediorum TaxID=1965231 RepID=UPI001E49E2FC|nr:HlyD family secretion protein [Campylobacter pinnipediorum]
MDSYCYYNIWVFWLFFAKVDIAVSASGKYIPSGNIKILKPFESGIISHILVKEGDKIKAKQPLIITDPNVSKSKSCNKRRELESLKILYNKIGTFGK